MIKVSDITYLFITFLRDNPCATAREIHEFIWDNAEILQGRSRYATKYAYDRELGGWYQAQTNNFYSGKLAYLTSLHYSNMIIGAVRTKSRAWVHRYHCEESGVHRFRLSLQGLAASGSIERRASC